MTTRYLTLLIYAIVISGITRSSFAQKYTCYTPDPITDTIPIHIERHILKRLNSDHASIDETDARVQKYLKQLYKDRADYVIATFNHDYLMVDSDLTRYLQEILSSIYAANPSLRDEPRIYAYRSDAVNAMSFGEGTIGFSLGLLVRLRNEGQVAFVICHELAHYLQRHSDQKLKKLARLNADRALNRKVKEIARSDYGKFSRFSHLKATIEADVTRHGREHEFEADSIALEWYLNAGYDPGGPTSLLEILDNADANDALDSIDLRKHFDFAQYPFKEKWLIQPQNDFVYASNARPDSLRTHPACQRRIEVLQKRIDLSAIQRLKRGEPERFANIVKKARYELATSMFHFGQFGKALYHFLMLSEHEQNDIYVYAMVTTSMHRIYQAQRNHVAGAVEFPDPRFPNAYNRFLYFIHALRTTEVGTLAYWHAIAGSEKFGDDELMLFTTWIACDTDATMTQRERYRSAYMEKFPDGRFRAQMTRSQVNNNKTDQY